MIGVSRVQIAADDLHQALADPVLRSATFLNEIASRYPEAISLAAGRPFDGFFDPRDLADNLAVYQRYLAQVRGLNAGQVTRELFQYGRTAGTIHELVAAMLRLDEDIDVAAESVVVVDGAQEGLLVVARALCHRPEDVLLVPSPCYIGMLGVARLLGIRVAAVPESDAGLDPGQVAQVAARVRAEGGRPRALYLVPDFANPSGHTMSVPARRRLLEVADAQDLLVIEDNPYGFLAETRSPTLKSLDRARRVIYVGTFAKVCFPGARVGFVVADQEVVRPDGSREPLAESLALIRSMTTVNTSSVAQAVVGGMLVRARCRLRRFNKERISFYRNNLRVVLRALDRWLPPETGVRWNRPACGFFIVLKVPFPADEDLLVTSARRYGVLWTPMSFFYPDGGGGHALRLSVSSVSPSDAAEGVRRLSLLVRDRVEYSVPC